MSRTVRVDEKLKARGQEVADALRASFRTRGIFVVNLIGSPGCGKTSLLESLAPRIRDRAAVIEGDLSTDEDMRRVERAGLRAHQVNTVGACHLDAGMVRDALAVFSLEGAGLLFIENVGNLVCPAGFDLGEDVKVAVVSVTEGDDKPAKYPSAMKAAGALVITKTDLLSHVDCDLERVRRDARGYHPDLPVFETSARTGEGVAAFLDWVDARAAKGKASQSR